MLKMKLNSNIFKCIKLNININIFFIILIKYLHYYIKQHFSQFICYILMKKIVYLNIHV